MYTWERGFPDGSAINNPSVNARDTGSWARKIVWRKKWQPTLLFLPGKIS